MHVRAGAPLSGLGLSLDLSTRMRGRGFRDFGCEGFSELATTSHYQVSANITRLRDALGPCEALHYRCRLMRRG